MPWESGNWGGGDSSNNEFASGATTFGGDSQWKNDGTVGGSSNGFNEAGASNGLGDSATAGGDGEDGANNGVCFNCGESGHNKSDCPNPQVFTGKCRHCKKQGHMSRDCPNAPPSRCGNCRKEGHYISDCPDPLVCPRCSEAHMVKECPLPMKCHHCKGEHMARDCPTYVATCTNCGEPDHTAANCKGARKVDRSHLPEMTGEEAWKLLEKAIGERDIDDVKEAVQVYIKAQPATTYVELESALRGQGYELYLIPKEKANLSMTMTNMDLQGNLGKKYTVNYRFSNKPMRPSEREGWPENQDEVNERLADAGEVVPLGIPKCANCNEMGHISRECPQEKMEPADRVAVKCFNCDEEGHRVRDCPTPRIDKFACKNCHKPGHKFSDCPQPRSAEGVECRKCNEMGHFSKDCPKGGGSGCRNCGQEGHMSKECPEPRNMANVQCRNCDEYGHTGKDCPKPKDMSRITCSNCQEKGHFKSRCPNPLVQEDTFGFNNSGGGGGGFDNDAGAADAGGDSSWQKPSDAVTAGGDTDSNTWNSGGRDAGGDAWTSGGGGNGW